LLKSWTILLRLSTSWPFPCKTNKTENEVDHIGNAVHIMFIGAKSYQ
jgi:hypothetical protein